MCTHTLTHTLVVLARKRRENARNMDTYVTGKRGQLVL